MRFVFWSQDGTERGGGSFNLLLQTVELFDGRLGVVHFARCWGYEFLVYVQLVEICFYRVCLLRVIVYRVLNGFCFVGEGFGGQAS